jgi:hypothetical protein
VKVVLGGILLALALAAPALALPLEDQVQVSQQPAVDADIAYNEKNDTFVVAYVGETGFGGQGIYVRHLDGDGDPVGSARKIADAQEMHDPAVTWVPQFDIYFVTWSALGGDGSSSIIARRLRGTTLGDLGSPTLVSEEDGTPEQRAAADATHPDIAAAFGRGIWALWSHDPLGDGDVEIHRKIFSQGGLTGDNVLDYEQISQAGPPARDPAIAWGDGDHAEHLMVWEQGTEIWGQIQAEVHGSDGIRRDDFQISTGLGSSDPAVAYNSATDEWLVTYQVGSQIRARRVQATGDRAVLLGEIEVSELEDFPAHEPAVAYNPDGQEWMVVWSGNGREAGGDEYEIYGRRIDSNGHKLGEQATRMSKLGAAGDGAFDSEAPSVAYGLVAKTFLATWHADHFADGAFQVWAGRGFAAEEPPDPGPVHNTPGTVQTGGGGSGGAPSGQGLPSGAGGSRRSSLPGGATIPLPGGARSFAVPVRCTGAGACSGSLRAETAKAFATAKARRVALGRARFTVAAGKTRKVKVKLTRPGRRLLARKRKLAVRLTLTMTGQKPVRRTISLRRA